MNNRILIIEPSEIINNGLRLALKRMPQLKVLEYRYLPEANIANEVIKLRPDVLIINPTLEGAVRQWNNEDLIAIALVYQYIPHERLNNFDAVIDIRDTSDAIAAKVAEALNKGLNDKKQSHKGNYELTKREQSVLVLVAKGLTNKAIADQLSVSIHTVISHRKNIVQKTGIKSVAGLTVYAMVNNLINE